MKSNIFYINTLTNKHNITTGEQASSDGLNVFLQDHSQISRVQIDQRELAFDFLPFAVFRWRCLGVYRRSSELFTFCFLHFFFNGLNINFVFCGCYKEENDKYYIMSSHAYSFELITHYKVILLINTTSLLTQITFSTCS